MKLFIKLSIWGYTICGILFFIFTFLGKNLPNNFIKPSTIGILAFVAVFLIISPRLFLNSRIGGDMKREHALSKLQSMIAFALIVNCAGGAGLYDLYKIGFNYDKLMHFIVPMMFAVVWAYFFKDWFGFGIRESALFASALTFAGGVVWEILEAFSDIFFGTQLLGMGSGKIVSDVVLDVVMDVLGIIMGIIWLYRRSRVAKAK
jgi:hypothetical protein